MPDASPTETPDPTATGAGNVDPDARTPAVRYAVSDAVATVSFSRPERRNSWNGQLEQEYFEAVMRASADPEVRVIVITGDPEGRAFCPGLDVQTLDKLSSGETGLERKQWPHTMLTQVPKPTIAAINGACAGLGLVQALYADVRFAQAGSKLTTAFARRGLPAENGMAWILTRLTGHAVACDLLLSGRTFTAEEAHELGIVKQVLPADELMDATYRYARDIADNCSPGAMAQIKDQIYTGFEQTMDEGRRLAVRYLFEERHHHDFAEGVRSYIEQRPPRFDGLGADLSDALGTD